LALLSLIGCAPVIRPVADLPIAPPKIQWELVGINGIPHTKVVERQRTCEDSDLYLLNHTLAQQTDGYAMDSGFIKQGTKLNSITFVFCAKRYYPGLPHETGVLGGRVVWERNGQEIATMPLTALDHKLNAASDAAGLVNDTPEQVRMAAGTNWTFAAGDKIRVYVTGGTDTGPKPDRVKLLDFFASINVTQP
jgi:hypothetical protein